MPHSNRQPQHVKSHSYRLGEGHRTSVVDLGESAQNVVNFPRAVDGKQDRDIFKHQFRTAGEA